MVSVCVRYASGVFLRQLITDMRFIKIYGLQRSGTNYLEWLLRNNASELQVLVDETGWKHGYIPKTTDWTGSDWSSPNMPLHEKAGFAERRRQRLGEAMEKLVDCIEKNELLYCFISKNPYSWYVSYARYKHFPISPIKLELIEHWCSLNHHWYQFFNKNRERCCFVRYEDFLSNPMETFGSITSHFKLRFSKESFKNCEHTLSMFAGKPESQLFDSSYYETKQYLHYFSLQDLDFFAKQLDQELLSMLDYELEPINYKQ